MGHCSSDPFDFPEGLPGLRSLDESMRCMICGDIYQVPTSLLCGHCYCSKCIRSHIACRVELKEQPKCPICRAACDESQVIPQLALKQIVGQYAIVRQFLLESVNGHAQASCSNETSRQKRRKTLTREPDGATSNGGMPVCKAKAPSKLCFNLMTNKQVREAVCNLGLISHGSRKTLELRYRSFRQYVETAIDNGTSTTIEQLAKEFNSDLRKVAFARTMGPSTDAPLDQYPSSFKDLIKLTKSGNKTCGGTFHETHLNEAQESPTKQLLLRPQISEDIKTPDFGVDEPEKSILQGTVPTSNSQMATVPASSSRPTKDLSAQTISDVDAGVVVNVEIALDSGDDTSS